jgi:cytochrome c oxidase subunit 1/cytochrome c oxidase subunit I+III
MHILGLEGMPRRDYTYPGGMGWTGPNLIETVGSYLLALGLLAVVVNLAVSLRRGVLAGNNPFGAPTLEWATTSPPPAYNFAVIPRVSSPYELWDREPSERDHRAGGGPMLDEGHETPASTLVDGDIDEILDMPSSSPWPPVLALALTGVFFMALLSQWIAAGVFLAAVAATLVAWHSKEPQEA